MSHEMPHEPTQHPAEAGGTPAAGTGPAHAALPFSEEELALLHVEDQKAGRNIVGLMLSIFIFGLIGYIAIDIWVH